MFNVEHFCSGLSGRFPALFLTPDSRPALHLPPNRATMATMPNYRPPPMRPAMGLFPEQDHHFLKTTAKALGITKCEFLRRIVHDAKVAYLQSGLYELPPEIKSTSKMKHDSSGLPLPPRKLGERVTTIPQPATNGSNDT